MIINFLGSVVALHIGDDPQLAVAYSIFMLGAVIAGTVLFFYQSKKVSITSRTYGDMGQRGI